MPLFNSRVKGGRKPIMWLKLSKMSVDDVVIMLNWASAKV